MKDIINKIKQSGKNIVKKAGMGLAGLTMMAGVTLGTAQEAQAQNKGGFFKDLLYSAASLYTQGKAANADSRNEAIGYMLASKTIDGMAQRDRMQQGGNTYVVQGQAQPNHHPVAPATPEPQKENFDLPDVFTYNSFDQDTLPQTDTRDFKGLERNVYFEEEELHLASKNSNVEEMTKENFYIFNNKGDLLKKAEHKYFPGALSPHNISGLEAGKYVFVSEIDGNLSRTEVSILPKGQMIAENISSGVEDLKKYIKANSAGVVLANDYIDLNNDGHVQAEEIFGAKINFKERDSKKAVVFSKKPINRIVGAFGDATRTPKAQLVFKKTKGVDKFTYIHDIYDYKRGEYKVWYDIDQKKGPIVETRKIISVK